MDDLTLRLDDNEELNPSTLASLLNNGAEALLKLSPAELIRLEKQVQNLKRQKSPTATLDVTSDVPTPKGFQASSKKRRHSEGGTEYIERPRPTGGQYMNLPASTPHVEYRDGIEWLVFTYSTKGHIQEYHIRADIDEIGPEEIPDEFKAENCVYPRALVPREVYIGNRWDYETSVNEIAWKLCWRNPGVLTGKRGLIQRAVDSYRNRTPENRSRRVMRQEKLHHNSPLVKRASTIDGEQSMGLAPTPIIRVPGPKTLTLQYAGREGEVTKIKIRVDIEGVDLAQVDDDFRANNAIFPQAIIGGPGYTTERWEYENACNELGWKLAWLNSAKLAGKRVLLHKAVEAYQSRVEAAERARQAVLHHHQQVLGQAMAYDPSMIYEDGGHVIDSHSSAHHNLNNGTLDKNEEFSQMVAQALQQALAQGVSPEGESINYHNSRIDASAYHNLPYPHAIVDDHQFHHHRHIHHEVLGPEHQRESRQSHHSEDDDHPNTMSTAELLRDL